MLRIVIQCIASVSERIRAYRCCVLDPTCAHGVLNTVPNHQDQFWDLIASPELLSTPIVLPSSQRAQVKDGELSLPSFMELADSLVLFRDEDVSQIRVRFLHETGSATVRRLGTALPLRCLTYATYLWANRSVPTLLPRPTA